MTSGAPLVPALTAMSPRFRRTIDGAQRLASLFGAMAVVVLFGGGALAVEAFKSSPGSFLSTSAPHVLAIVVGSVTLFVSAILGFFAYVLSLLSALVAHTVPNPPAHGE